MRHFLTILTAALVAGSAVAPASAADYQQAPIYGSPGYASATLPACDDAAVLGQVEDQFEYGAPRVLEVPLEILEFSGMIEKAYFPAIEEGEPAISPIERRYCQASALISDRRTRTVYYVIEYPMGFAGAGGYLGAFSPVKGWRAEGCVLGLDEWHVYGANCQSLRRFQPEGRTGFGYVTK